MYILDELAEKFAITLDTELCNDTSKLAEDIGGGPLRKQKACRSYARAWYLPVVLLQAYK